MNARKRLAAAVTEALEPRQMLAKVGPDVDFGDGGKAAASADVYLASLPDGKILAVSGSSDAKRVTQLNSDGSLDNSFGDGGFASVTKEDNTSFAVVSGTQVVLADSTNATVVSVEAVNLSDGSEDLSFGQNGLVRIFPPASNVVSAVITGISAGPNDTTYIAFNYSTQEPDDGSIGGGSGVVRLTPTGDLDSTFGTDGYAIGLPFATIATDPDGGVVAAGADDDSGPISVIRLAPDGKVDSAFNIKTAAALAGQSFDSQLPFHIAAQAGGDVILETTAESSDQTDGAATLLAVTDSGALDTSFGSKGIATISSLETVNVLAVDSEDRILIGSGKNVVRLTADGQTDDSFNDNGVATIGDDDVFKLASDDSGRVLVGDANDQVIRLSARQAISLGSNGTLYVDGTDADDTLSIKVSGSNVQARLNGNLSTFAASAVKNVQIAAGDGDNVIDAAIDVNVSVVAGSGNDSITTAGGDDTILGGLGDDTIHSGDGNDTIFSAVENDFQDTTTDGNNLIVTGDGDKTIRLGDGRDTVQTGVGNHIIDDSPSTAGGTFTIAGGQNTLTLRGANYDVTIGGSGNNTVFCSAGTNHITTGDGDDIITSNGDATINSGGGNDHVIVGQFQNAGGPALLLDLGAGNDVAECGNGNVTAHGGDGSDSIKSGLGNDFLYGDAGGDTLRGGFGSDLISGGGGRDHLFGQQGKDRIYGGNGNDAIDAGPGDDRSFGQAGDDVIEAGVGNDQLDGGAGSDYLAAGPGDDTLTANDGVVDSVYGGAGNDSAHVDAGIDVLRDLESVS